MRSITVFVAALLLVVGCMREIDRLKKQATQEPTAENYIALGNHRLKAKHYEAAVSSFREAVKLDPSSPKAHHNLGVAYVRLGRNQEALEAFRLSHRLKLDYKKLLIPLQPPGISGERSLEALRQAAASRPGDAQAAFALAQGYQRAAMLEEALAQHRHVVASSPRHAGGYYGMGSALAQLGRYDDAVRPLREAIRLKPTWAAPHYTLGFVYLLRGDVDEAFREYQILRQMDASLADQLFARIYE
ncbi:MAG: tetratricopeptide repeat protein [bacterium]